MFENPTANLSALCNSCAKIACCSSELIFAFIYACSSIQNASGQFLRIHFFFVNFALRPNSTNKNLTGTRPWNRTKYGMSQCAAYLVHQQPQLTSRQYSWLRHNLSLSNSYLTITHKYTVGPRFNGLIGGRGVRYCRKSVKSNVF
jgi:hypothetical protein